jgi:hypothetical protein
VARAHWNAAHRRSRAWDLATTVWKQEEGTGLSTPVGTRRQRGLDGRATMDRGGGWSSSTRGRSRCGGEERRAAASAMWRGGDEGAFYRGGEVVARRGDSRPSGGRGALSRRRLLKGETMGQR